jgi:uncharacterized protein (TIGR02246 family)
MGCTILTLIGLVVQLGVVENRSTTAEFPVSHIDWLGQAQSTSSSPAFASTDRDAVVAVTQEYRDAWLANDSTRVMAVFTANAILLPSGLAPVAGESAMRAFWFPTEGARTTVTAMEQNVTDVTGSGNRAVATGRGSLSFKVGDEVQVRTQISWFANVLAKQSDGRWLITKRIWVDLP